ncbi:TetR/AcrR family transcriptional regulator [Kitasatospora sp. NPDC048286]|uniref:TetR/AcrR family transcriptional regulator n=1 Tax=Kitasatospora sp. NPDC048286 TaxID=3364047 RepID=UPI003714D8C8
MSPRHTDPSTRPALVDIAARLLAEEGPQALSARRIASEIGASTMALYTHFNGMRGLVRAMVHEGFARLQHYFTLVEFSDDPVSDLALLGRAYRLNALANPHLYAVMFGGSSLAGFSLGEEDRQYGRYTLAGVAECAARCIEAGRFRAADADLVAHQMWSAVHGLVVLELGDYLTEPWNADSLLEAQLVGLMVAVGDTREAAVSSVSASAERLREEVDSATDAD